GRPPRPRAQFRGGPERVGPPRPGLRTRRRAGRPPPPARPRARRRRGLPAPLEGGVAGTLGSPLPGPASRVRRVLRRDGIDWKAVRPDGRDRDPVLCDRGPHDPRGRNRHPPGPGHERPGPRSRDERRRDPSRSDRRPARLPVDRVRGRASVSEAGADSTATLDRGCYVYIQTPRISAQHLGGRRLSGGPNLVGIDSRISATRPLRYISIAALVALALAMLLASVPTSRRAGIAPPDLILTLTGVQIEDVI